MSSQRVERRTVVGLVICGKGWVKRRCWGRHCRVQSRSLVLARFGRAVGVIGERCDSRNVRFRGAPARSMRELRKHFAGRLFWLRRPRTGGQSVILGSGAVAAAIWLTHTWSWTIYLLQAYRIVYIYT